MRVKLSDLRDMDEAKRNETLALLVTTAKKPRRELNPNMVDAYIRGYEEKFGMTSEEARAKFGKELPETEETCRWMVLISGRT